MSRYLAALYDEHRSIAAVLHAMDFLISEQRAGHSRFDPKVFRAMLYYLDVFPERIHHAHEEQYLFKTLRQRAPEAAPVLDVLGAQHAGGMASIRRLEQALLRYVEGGNAEFPEFAAAVEKFIATYREHMRREEEEVMPLAERALTAADWAQIEAAFAEHKDPLKDAEGVDYHKIYSRIVAIAPAPLGLGPSS